MALNLRTALEILRLYGPMWLALGLFAMTSATRALTALSFTEAQGENT